MKIILGPQKPHLTLPVLPSSHYTLSYYYNIQHTGTETPKNSICIYNIYLEPLITDALNSNRDICF